jgi:hypothetical protein
MATAEPDYLPLSAVSFENRAKLQAALRAQRATHARHVNEFAFGLSPAHPLRAACIFLVSSRVLGTAVFYALLLNLVVLFATLDPFASPLLVATVGRVEVEYFLSALFTAELAVKLCALGLFGRRGFFYKHRPQRPLELLLVIFSWASLGAREQRGLVVARAVRTIRLLDFFDFLPDMSIIIATVSASVPMLLNVLLIIFVECLAFALLATDLWQGALGGTCGMPRGAGAPPLLSTSGERQLMAPTFCVSSCGPSGRLHCDLMACPAFALAPPALNLSAPLPFSPANVSCFMGTNADWGSTNFDNVAAAVANAFVMLSTEGWSAVMYRVMAVSSQPALVAAIFVAHLVLGAYFFLELALAVVVSAYAETVGRETLRISRLFMLLQLAAGKNEGSAPAAALLASAAAGEGAEGGGGGGGGDGAAAAPPALQGSAPGVSPSLPPTADGHTEALVIARSMALWTEGRELSDRVYGPMPIRSSGGGAAAAAASAPAPAAAAAAAEGETAAAAAALNSLRLRADAKDVVALALLADGFFDTSAGKDSHFQRRRRLSSVLDVPAAAAIVARVVSEEEAPLRAAAKSAAAGNARRALERLELLERVQRTRALTPGEAAEKRATEATLPALKRELEAAGAGESAAPTGWRARALDAYRARVPNFCCACARGAAASLVRQRAFRILVSLLCVINVGIFALSVADNSSEADDALWAAHMGILIAFLAEWAIRMVDKGPRALLSTPFNCLDLAVVVASFLDAVASQDLSLISVLRLSRVLYESHLEMWGWTSMRLLVGSLGHAARISITSLTVLLVSLLTFAFAGMALFNYEKNAAWAALAPLPPRMTYRSFGLAIVTTFQMMDNENWDATIKAHVAAFGGTAVVFFTLVEVVGTLLFLNLLIAMLVGAMERFKEETSLKDVREAEQRAAARGAGALAAADAQEPPPLGSSSSSGPVARSRAAAPTPTPPRSKRLDGAPPPLMPAAGLSMSVHLGAGGGSAALDAMTLNIPAGAKAKVPAHLAAEGDLRWWDEGEARGVVSSDGVMRVVPAGHPADPAHPDFSQGSLVGAIVRNASIARRWASARVAPLLRAPTRAWRAVTRRGVTLPQPAGDADASPPPAASGGRPRRGSGGALAPPPPAALPLEPLSPATPRKPAGGSSAGGGSARALDGAASEGGPAVPCAAAFAAAVLGHRGFVLLSNCVLVVSCANLALDSPLLYPCSGATCEMVHYIGVADLFFAAFFSLELALSLAALWPTRGAWRSAWLALDALVVAVTIAGVLLVRGQGSGSAVRALRSARALRVLLLIQRVPALRLVVQSMVSALPRAKESMVVLMVFTVAFAVCGMFILRRKMNVCNDPAVYALAAANPEAACVGTFNVTGRQCEFLPTAAAARECRGNPWGAPFPRRWAPIPESFDTFANALLTVFELCVSPALPPPRPAPSRQAAPPAPEHPHTAPPPSSPLQRLRRKLAHVLHADGGRADGQGLC